MNTATRSLLQKLKPTDAPTPTDVYMDMCGINRRCLYSAVANKFISITHGHVTAQLPNIQDRRITQVLRSEHVKKIVAAIKAGKNLKADILEQTGLSETQFYCHVLRMTKAGILEERERNNLPYKLKIEL